MTNSFKLVVKMLLIALTIFSVVTHAQTNENKCVTAENEPLRKICTDKSVQSYLLQNFQQTVSNIPELADVVCKWELPVTPPRGLFANGPTNSITCENNDLTHRILIGWAGDEKYMKTNAALGNTQLFLRGKNEDGRLFCVETKNFSKIANAVTGAKCTMTTKFSDEKISSAVVYMKNPAINDRKLFIAVMNITGKTSEDELETFLLKVLSTE